MQQKGKRNRCRDSARKRKNFEKEEEKRHRWGKDNICLIVSENSTKYKTREKSRIKLWQAELPERLDSRPKGKVEPLPIVPDMPMRWKYVAG